MRKHISIKTALFIPFGIFIAVLLGMLIFVWQQDYNWLAKEQGGKIVTAVNQNTKQKLHEILMAPQEINAVYASTLSTRDLTDGKDLSEIQAVTETYIKTIRETMPQISVVSYGDEKKRFVGLRTNDDTTYSLMLKDERTNAFLNIYETEAIQSKVLGVFEDYDPTTRPWYAPVKAMPKAQWSDIYVNADEKMDITISSLMPVFDETGKLRGVTDVDVKLNGIAAFLKSNQTKGSGVIYIADKKWNLIAHSGAEPAMQLGEDRKGNQIVVMSRAYEAENPMVKATAQFINDKKIEYNKVEQITFGSDHLYVEMAELKLSDELSWRIVSVIPEKDLMGTVRKHQNTSMWVILVMAAVVSGLSFFVISMLIKPVKESAKAAVALSQGNFDKQISPPWVPISEMDELMHAFNDMADSLKISFEHIQMSEEKYRSLVENIDDMIYSLTPEGKFVAVNYRFEKELTVSRNEIIGKGLEVIFRRPDELQFWNDQLKRVIEMQTMYTYQFSYVKEEDNKRHVYNVHLIPMVNSLGVVELVLGSATDITDLIEAQEEIQALNNNEKETLEQMVNERTIELKSAMAELYEKEKMASLGGLVSGVAHEINTPLGVSVSAASYLKIIKEQIDTQMAEGKLTKGSLTDFLRNLDETSKILDTNLYRASELVKSFKEISVSQITEEQSVFNFHEYLQMVLLSLKHEYKNSGHEIHIICDESLMINSYPGVFSQIFTNLIMNALIHGLKEKEHGIICVAVKKDTDTGQLDIEFWDTGMGISEYDLSRIFDPFFTTSRGSGGSGLGLHVVYNLVTVKLGGRISCQSSLGEGTHFYIRIPNVLL
jgi:PAS domain S-box-containing protein